MKNLRRHWTSLITAVGIFASLATHADERNEHASLVERYYSQFQKPGFLVDELMQFYADDVIFIDPTFEIIANGKGEVRKLYAELGTDRTAYKNIQWKIKSVTSDQDRVVVRGTWSGRFYQCDFDIEFMTLWTISDGLIVEQNDFFAASTFDRQVGWNADLGTPTC